MNTSSHPPAMSTAALWNIMASWAKKKLSKLRIHIFNGLPLLEAPPASSTMPPQEIVLAADLRCITCQKRITDAISRLDDMESLVVHVAEKKVTLACRSAAGSSKKLLLPTTKM